LDIILKNK
jgi:hypothetical protein